MKQIFFILILMTPIMTQAQAQAQTTETQRIETIINHYFDGIVNHKPEGFEKAFTKTATMKSFDNEYSEVNAIEALSSYVTANEPVKTKTSITSISIIENAASVQLTLEYETFSFIDFMHLLKIDGEWKIVSKTYTTKKKDF
ncbi:MAG: nuclear transport factor 2 family protein [Saprospiraceae bacterium]